jgi:hypothetical protein
VLYPDRVVPRQLFPLIVASLNLLAQPAVFHSKKAPADVPLTADPNSNFWRGVEGLVVTTDYAGNPVENHRTEIRSRWTPENLYLLYICHYEQLNLKPSPSTQQETNQLWNWDVAEAFLGADFNDIVRYKEFQVSPQGEWVDLDIDRSPQKRGAGVGWNSRFEVKARVDEAKKIWYGAMKIPLASIGVKSPSAGTEVRAGLYRIAGREPSRKLISWQKTGARSFHVPERFGILRLSE